MTQQSAEQFLLGGGGASARFETVGASVTGTIASPPEVRQQTKMGTGEPLTWDNGDPKMQLVVALATQLRDNDDDDGIRNLYVKGSRKPESGSMHAAVAAAVSAAGAKGLDVGGRLTVTYTGDGTASTPGFNPPKHYTATYTAPDASEFLGTQPPAQQVNTPQGQVNTTTGVLTQPAAAQAAVGPTREQVAALRAAGIDPAGVFGNYSG